MWTWCTKEDWEDDNFDLSWAGDVHGLYSSKEEALREAERRGARDVVVFCIE